jgi:hypothetical protein
MALLALEKPPFSAIFSSPIQGDPSLRLRDLSPGGRQLVRPGVTPRREFLNRATDRDEPIVPITPVQPVSHEGVMGFF